MDSGIYLIKNILDDKVYIGSSINLKDRRYKHFWMLERGIHDNQHLQNSYNKFGEENFKFEILENCEYDLLVEKENYYIEKYKSIDSEFGFNLAKVTESRRNNLNEIVKKNLSKHNLNKNGNFNKFRLIEIETDKINEFDNLVDAANYLIDNGFSKGKKRSVRMKLSSSLRGVKLNNGHKGSIRKTCYKHKFEIIN
jgi:group I intron endonuclease